MVTVYDAAGTFLATVSVAYADRQVARGGLLATDHGFRVPTRGLRPLTGAEKRRQHLASLR